MSTLLTIDPDKLRDENAPAGVRIAHGLPPVAGYLGMVGGILGPVNGHSIQLDVRVKLGVSEGATQVSTKQLAACLKIAESTLVAMGGKVFGRMLLGNLVQQTGKVLAASGNDFDAALKILVDDDCDCAECAARKHGIDDLDGLTELAREVAAGKPKGPPPMPPNPAPLQLGTRSLGDGWYLRLEMAGKSYSCYLSASEYGEVGFGEGFSMHQALVDCLADALKNDVTWSRAAANSLAALGTLALVESIDDQTIGEPS